MSHMSKKPMIQAIAAAALLGTAVLAGEAPVPTPELLDKGRQSFAQACAACHGETGNGDGAAAATLSVKPRSFVSERLRYGGKVEQILRTVERGVPETPMSGFGHLPEEELWALAYWVLELKAGRSKR
jgi:mono/diheme cytochrome c family protein